MSDLTQLLCDLKAEPREPSRRLDCAIAVAIDGFFMQGERYGEPNYCYVDDAGSTVCSGQHGDMLVPRYTQSVDAALRLLTKVLPDFDWIIGHTNGGLTIHAQVGPNEMVFGETPALALCIAIVEAKIAEVKS